MTVLHPAGSQRYLDAALDAYSPVLDRATGPDDVPSVVAELVRQAALVRVRLELCVETVRHALAHADDEAATRELLVEELTRMLAAYLVTWAMEASVGQGAV